MGFQIAKFPRAAQSVEDNFKGRRYGDSNDGTADTVDLAGAYRALGYADGSTLKYVLQPGGAHTESAWASRLPAAFEFLLGPGR